MVSPLSFEEVLGGRVGEARPTTLRIYSKSAKVTRICHVNIASSLVGQSKRSSVKRLRWENLLVKVYTISDGVGVHIMGDFSVLRTQEEGANRRGHEARAMLGHRTETWCSTT